MSHFNRIINSFLYNGDVLNVDCNFELTKGSSTNDISIDTTALSIPAPQVGQTVIIPMHIYYKDAESRDARGDGSILLNSNVTWDAEGADGTFDFGSSTTDHACHYYIKKWTGSDPSTITFELVDAVSIDPEGISYCIIILDDVDADSSAEYLNNAYVGGDAQPWKNSVPISTFGLPGVVVPAGGRSFVHMISTFGANGLPNTIAGTSAGHTYTQLSSDVSDAGALGQIWTRQAGTSKDFYIHRPDLTKVSATPRHSAWSHISFFGTNPAGDATDPTTLATFDQWFTNDRTYNTWMFQNSALSTARIVDTRQNTASPMRGFKSRTGANHITMSTATAPNSQNKGGGHGALIYGGNLKTPSSSRFHKPPVASSSLTSIEMFAVVSIGGWRGGSTIATNPANCIVYAVNSTAVGINRHVEFGINAGTKAAFIKAYNGTSKSTLTTGTAQPYGNLYVYGYWKQGGTSSIDWNGVTAAGVISGTSQSKSGGGESVGQWIGRNEATSGGALTDYLPGKIMEIGIRYNAAAMSAAAKTSLINWAKANYGVVDNPTVGGDI